MDARLLDILVCPVCKGPLEYDKKAQEMICRGDRLAYPVRDGGQHDATHAVAPRVLGGITGRVGSAQQFAETVAGAELHQPDADANRKGALLPREADEADRHVGATLSQRRDHVV